VSLKGLLLLPLREKAGMRGLQNKGLSFLPLTLALSRKGRGDFSDTLLRRNDGEDVIDIHVSNTPRNIFPKYFANYVKTRLI
jgi:hypothetical protein